MNQPIFSQRVHIITQTFPPKVGGMEAVMQALAEKFSRNGADVIVYPNHAYFGAATYRLSYRRCPKLVRACLKKRRVSARSSQEDVFICDSWKSVNALPSFARHVIILAHGQEYLHKEKHQKRIQKALDRASHIVAASAYTLGLMRKSWNIHHTKAEVIHPTYSLADSTENKIPLEKSEAVRMVTMSRIEARKGLAQVIECLAKYQDKLPHYTWEIGGSGPQSDALKQRVLSLGLSDCIHFRGRVSDAEKQRMLSQADMFVMPSYQEGSSLEGFGISYIEAARYGVPAIAGLAGGASEAVRHLETGWCVDVNDENSLELTLKEALSNTTLREKLGAEAQKRYGEELAGNKAFKAFVEFIAS